jgi:hypothetical protein
MARFEDHTWHLPETADGKIAKWEYVPIALLMDIRDELQTLNQLLNCQNFLDMPGQLRKIAANTTKKRRSK